MEEEGRFVNDRDIKSSTAKIRKIQFEITHARDSSKYLN